MTFRISIRIKLKGVPWVFNEEQHLSNVNYATFEIGNKGMIHCRYDNMYITR